jgi:hypothetical protein
MLKAYKAEYMLKTAVKHPNPVTKVLLVYNSKKGLEKGSKKQKLGNT